MTRKDFKAIASVIKHNSSLQSAYTPHIVADILQAAFPNFDREKFEEACKPESETE
jgi:hypothetical protein